MILLLIVVLFQEPLYHRPVDLARDLKILQQRSEKDPLDHEAWAKKIATYTALGELNQLLPILDLLHQAAPKNLVYGEARMIALSQHGHHKLATDLGEKLLAQKPGHPTLAANLARAYLQATPTSIRGTNLMLSALQRGPLQVSDWDLLLRALARTWPDPQALLDDLETRIQQHPNLSALKYVKMVCLVRFGRYEEAQAILKANPDLSKHPDLQSFMSQVSGIRNQVSDSKTPGP